MLLIKWVHFVNLGKRVFRRKKKRAHQRVEYKNLIKYEPGDGSVPSLVSNLVDISQGGLQLSMNFRPRIGTVLNMLVNLVGTGHDLPLSGKVVWVKSISDRKNAYRVGIAFEEITEADRDFLRTMTLAAQPKLRKH